MSKKESIILLDGNALLHRAWHALPPLMTKDGRVVNAVYGFAMVVERLLETEKPDYMVVAWDLPSKTFRHKKFAYYKAHRKKKEKELYDQIPMIQELLSFFGIPSLSVEGFEADDVIGTLSDKAGKKGIYTRIVTGDLDSLQLVNDQSEVIFFLKGISQTKIYNPKAVIERYGLTPDRLNDYKALKGDPSDNIPGVAGIGDKSATLLIQKFKTIDSLFKALKNDEVEEKFAKKLRGSEQDALDSLELVTIVLDVPMPFRFSEAKIKEPNWDKIMTFYREMDFRTLLRKHRDKNEVPPVDDMDNTISRTSSIEIIKKKGDLKEFLTKISGEIAVFVAEQPTDLFGETLSAVVISDGVLTRIVPNPTNKQLKDIGEAIQNTEKVVVHDLKDLMWKTEWKFDSAKTTDLMIASYLLHSSSRVHDIVSALYAILGSKIPELPETYLTDKDYKKLGSICFQMPKAAQVVRAAFAKDKMIKVFEDIEMPLVSVLFEMEKEGIQLDITRLEKVSKRFIKEINRLTKIITKLAGREFNLNSPSQLAEILFSDLALSTKGIKKTKTGLSTAASELDKLFEAHEIIPLIKQYRELAKLQSTYVEALPKLVGKDGRIHTSFNQTIAATGRLSSSDPNLQNIPIKTDLGNEIRKTFVAGKGKRLIAADYSQIELRLASIIAGDKPFIKAFKEGVDIHIRTAAQVFNLDEDKVTKNDRRKAKAVNFGILYGMGPRSLARSTDMKFEEAKDFIDRYFQIHHAFRDYMDKTKAKAHKLGYVETLFGRRRQLPEIESGVPQLIAMAERMAVNMPIQGTQADILKLAMIAVNSWLKQSGWPAILLLQVHDELILECEVDAVNAVAKGLKEIMESITEYEVPLVVDVEVGKNWGEMKSWGEK